MRTERLTLSGLVLILATSCMARGELSVTIDTTVEQPVIDVTGADVITSLSVIRCAEGSCSAEELSGDSSPCDSNCTGDTLCAPPADVDRCMWHERADDYTGSALYPALPVPQVYPSDVIDGRSLNGSQFSAWALAEELSVALTLTPGEYIVRAVRSGGGGLYSFLDSGTETFEVR